MKTRLATLLYFLIPFFTSAQKISNYRLDPDNARGGKTSNLFTQVRFIPLETTKESLFGNISKMEVSMDYFVIYDSNTGEIFLFEKTGKFHSSIKKRKANEYIGDFSLNEQDKEIFVWVGEKILVYDFEAKLKREEKAVKDGAQFHYFNKSSILFNLNRNLDYLATGEIGYDIGYAKGFGNIQDKYLSYNKKYQKYDYNMLYTSLNSHADGTVIFSFPYDYTVSRFGPNGLTEQYRFIFPQKYSLPTGFTNDSSFVNKRKDFVFGRHPENRDKIIGLSPFFNVGDYFVFYCDKIGTSFTYTDNLLYSTKTSTLYALDRLTGDSLSYFIPILDSHLSENLHSVSAGSIYTSIPAQVLMQLKTNAKTPVKYSAELEVYFNSPTRKDNPIIIESILKSNL